MSDDSTATPPPRKPRPGAVLRCTNPECRREFAFVPGHTAPGLCYFCAAEATKPSRRRRRPK